MPRIKAESIEAHKGLVRRELLDAVHAYLCETRSADVSLAEVAARAGIGRTTFYEYFRDRDDLVASLVEEILPGVVERLMASVPPEGTYSERLRAMAVATVEYLAADEVLGLILHRELPRLGQMAQDRIAMAHADLTQEMAALYRKGVAAGEFVSLPPALAGRLIHEVTMAGGKAVIASAGSGEAAREVAGITADFLVRALRVA
jgi:AcrR family transcriptional regulator